MRTALVQKFLQHFGCEFRIQIELNGIVNHSGDSGCYLWDVKVVSNGCFEFFDDHVVAFVVLFDAFFQGLDLWTNDGSCEIAHSDRVVGMLHRLSFEVLRTWNRCVLAVEAFIGSCNDGSLSGDFGIICQQESTLTGIDHLVTLTTDGTSDTLVSGVFALPENTQRMSSIFQQNCVVFVAKVFDGIHVGQFSAHVRNQDVVAVGIFVQFLFQIDNVHNMVTIGFDVNSFSIGVFNGRRDGSECKSIRQNFAAGF
mmetsp:Transcript_2618/g.6277  ORF Transcript_2618/g.6277 Transcript_2618/m.6277 type:complete len:254 (-) Transcript_2618:1-762(-)